MRKILTIALIIISGSAFCQDTLRHIIITEDSVTIRSGDYYISVKNYGEDNPREIIVTTSGVICRPLKRKKLTTRKG